MGLPARIGRGLRAAAALGLAAILKAFSVVAHEGRQGVDAFYGAPYRVPRAPGQLLRSERFSTGIPSTAKAWRILYTTTRDDGQRALASGIVLVSKTAPRGPRPVIAWAHGTTGYAQNCAPSLLADPIGAGAMPALDRVVANGWALVATDYIGLGTAGPHTYLIGQGEGRAVFDAVRAARQLHPVSLSDKTVVWGHSEGGGAALWTGQLASTYAPDVPLAGVVAMAPASDLVNVTNHFDHMIGGSVLQSFIISAYSATCPDVHYNDYVRPGARVIEQQAARRCLAEPSTLISIAASLGITQSILAKPADQGPLGTRLRQNTPSGPISAPLLIAQGEQDQIVLASMQQHYVRSLCGSGRKLDYRSYPGLDHIGLVGKDSALITDRLTWTQDRFDGKAAVTDSCRTP